MSTYTWLVKREFWENRASWLIPLAIGALMVLASLFGRVDLLALNSPLQGRAIGGFFLLASGASFYVIMLLYASWYLMDCLFSDRKDRSVLFWKSLPISDTATVLSKLAMALIVIPLVYFVAADLTALMLAFIISIRASATVGGSLWQGDQWLQLQVLWLYLIVTTAIWYLPIAAWLIVVSAWAKRAVMLWAVLPPIALILAERWFFGTSYVAAQIGERLLGFAPEAFRSGSAGAAWASATVDNATMATSDSVWRFMNAAGFLTSPETLIGVAVGVGLVACAVQLRLRRTEI